MQELRGQEKYSLVISWQKLRVSAVYIWTYDTNPPELADLCSWIDRGHCNDSNTRTHWRFHKKLAGRKSRYNSFSHWPANTTTREYKKQIVSRHLISGTAPKHKFYKRKRTSSYTAKGQVRSANDQLCSSHWTLSVANYILATKYAIVIDFADSYAIIL